MAGAAITAVLEWARIAEFRTEGSPVATVRRRLPKRVGGRRASRQVEMRRATWEQFDPEATVWVKPAQATKTAKPHRVPLSRQALSVLADARKRNRGALVFPGTRPGAMMGNVVMTQALRNAGVAGSGHGFRSSCRGVCSAKPLTRRDDSCSETPIGASGSEELREGLATDAWVLREQQDTAPGAET